MASISEKIRGAMPVVASDGRQVGVVGVADSTGLRMTSIKNGQAFDHAIPLSWVTEVDKYVFLNKSSGYITANWEASAGSPWASKAA